MRRFVARLAVELAHTAAFVGEGLGFAQDPAREPGNEQRKANPRRTTTRTMICGRCSR